MTSQADSPNDDKPGPRPRRRARRALLWSLGILLLAGGVALAVRLYVMDRSMAAPDWLRDRIEARIDALWPAGDVALGGISFQLRRSLDVSVTIDNVALSTADGVPVLDLARLDATLARRGLVRAQIEPKAISAAGIFLTLERAADGTFNLAFGQSAARSAPDFGALLAQIDSVIETPEWVGLRRVTLDAVTLEYRDLVSRRAWVIDGGRIAASRSREAITVRGDLALLSGGADVATLAVTATSPVGSRAVSLGVSVDNMPAADMATQSPALAWLGVLRAPISGALRGAVDDDGTFAPLNATLQIGAGVLQPSDATRPIPFRSARTYFTFDPADAHFEFTEISLDSAGLTASGTATAMLETEEATGLTGLTAQIALSALEGNPGGVFPDGPRRLDAVQADLHLALDPFHLRVGRLTAEAGAVQILGEADVTAAQDGWSVSTLIKVPRAEPGEVLAFWPEDRVPKTRNWIATNVPSGVFRNVQTHIRVVPDAPPKVYLGAEIEDAQVRALRAMPLLSVTAGRLTLEGRELVIVADRSHMEPGRGGRLDTSGTRFRIIDTRQRPGAAEVQVRTDGSIEATLALLDYPPLEIMSRANRPVDLAQGRAILTTDLAFPLRPRVPASEVLYEASGVLENMQSDQIVPGRVLQSERLAVAVDPQSVRLFGPGTLSGVPFEAEWQMPLTGPRETRQSTLQADVTLSEAGLAAFGVALPPGTMRGEGQGRLIVDLPRGALPQFSLSSQLDGIGLSIPALGWSISEGTKGRFAISGALGEVPRIDRVSLEAPRLQAEGRLVLQEGGGLQQAELDRVRVGGWLDAAVTVAPRGPGRAPDLVLRSGRIDLRNAPFGGAASVPGAEGRNPTRSEEAAVILNGVSLQINDTLRLDALQGEFTSAGGLRGPFTARVNGGTAIEGRALRRNGRTGADIRASDAGALLRDAGLFRDMTGGRFLLKLRPSGAPGTFDGELAIDEVRVRNAPTMAALLNAVSVVGLIDEMTGQGIYFEEIDAEFRLTPTDLTLTAASAVGPSMGLSLDGYYDLANKALDFQGVVSPLYAVNILGRVIARRGEGLIGISFTMQGPASAPEVTANPLSALTPGMFREIFRRPPPVLSE